MSAIITLRQPNIPIIPQISESLLDDLSFTFMYDYIHQACLTSNIFQIIIKYLFIDKRNVYIIDETDG